VSPVIDEGANPLWSPSGRWLASTTRMQELVIVHGDGSGRRVLTRGSNAGLASWAHDSRHLAVVTTLAHDADHLGLYVVRVDGVRPRRIASMLENAAPAWSPDGTRIAFSAFRQPPED
jgi:Tol biopolymer transport system component